MSKQLTFDIFPGDTFSDSKEYYLLISLHQEYLAQIQAGVKKFEYRRKFFAKPAKAFVYVNSPISQIAALVTLGFPIIDSVEKIAQIAENVHSGHGKAIVDYMDGLQRGYAIPILNCKELKRVHLRDIRAKFPHFAPPQSYIILNNYPPLLEYLLGIPYETK